MTTATTSEKEARTWKKELRLADKREKDWRSDSEKVIKRYRGEERKKNRFNVLWSNTETLRPAIYNSRPNPDVRRRFRDADPLGKAVSEILERSLMVMIDYECTDQTLKNDTLDGLLCGRGVSRIRYIPSIKQVEKREEPEDEDTGVTPESAHDQEEVEYEQVLPEHVDWRDFRHGFGRVWDEVPWVAFRHKLSRPDAQKKFDKDDIKGIVFSEPANPEEPEKLTESFSETTKVSEFWEIWDKISDRVFFFNDKCDELLFPTDNKDGAPPIAFSGFFPVPEPLKIIENTGSLLPIIPFDLYRQQADELDKLSGRIDRITEAMRLRGIYDSKLTELGDLMVGEDNELTPVQNAQAWGDGGLDKAISWFPTEKAATLLESLYQARDRQKAIIDELTGITDIRRGVTDPEETLGAQEIKQANGDVRLHRYRQEVQRYAKDLIRLGAEAMCDKFAPQTFAQMTELQFPTQQMKQQAQQQQGMQQPGAPPPPPNPMLQMPTWEDIMQLMKSSGMRRFRVDVETDSTVAGTLNADMEGLTQLLEAIGKTLQGMAPLVQSGSMPVDAAKEVVMAVVRRARLGLGVEDAFEKMKAPNPPGPPESVQVAQVKAQTDKEALQAKTQADIAKAQAEQQAQAQSRQAELQMELQKSQQEAQLELQKDAQAKQHELALKQHEGDIRLRELALQLENERLIADANNQTKVQVAEIGAVAKVDVASTAASYAEEEGSVDA